MPVATPPVPTPTRSDIAALSAVPTVATGPWRQPPAAAGLAAGDPLYTAIVENARLATGARLVALSEVLPGGASARLVAYAGTGANVAARVVEEVQRLLPGFDPARLTFPPHANPVLGAVFTTGRPRLARFEDAAAGAIDSRATKVAGAFAGITHAYLCPLLRDGRVTGLLSFHTGHEPHARERTVCDAFAQQATLTLENAYLAAALRQEQACTRAQEARLDVALKAARASAWVWDLEARRALLCMGTQIRLADGTPLHTAWDYRAATVPEDLSLVDAAYAAARAGERRIDARYRLRDSQGTITWVHICGQVYDADADGPRRLVAISRDITAEKEAAAEHERRQRLDGALLMARTVAHEVNNALAPVSGYAELLTLLPAVRTDPQATAMAHQVAEAAVAVAERIGRLQRIIRLEEDEGTLGPAWSVLDVGRSLTGEER